jgi:hypothetical protein
MLNNMKKRKKLRIKLIDKVQKTLKKWVKDNKKKDIQKILNSSNIESMQDLEEICKKKDISFSYIMNTFPEFFNQTLINTKYSFIQNIIKKIKNREIQTWSQLEHILEKINTEYSYYWRKDFITYEDI